MKPVSGFLADNGKFFEDEVECVNYEQYIGLRRIITHMRPQHHGLSGTGNANETLTKFIEELITGYPEMVIAMAERHTVKAKPKFEPTHIVIPTGKPVLFVDRIDAERSEVEYADGSRMSRLNRDLRAFNSVVDMAEAMVEHLKTEPVDDRVLPEDTAVALAIEDEVMVDAMATPLDTTRNLVSEIDTALAQPEDRPRSRRTIRQPNDFQES
ncbi:hypothetical protein MYOV003v1_p0009 [Vibrio phage 207E48.1]|nr:hypothetical protein MYOV003v1_p0009 [Vibrio phage 207E48.1]